MSQWNVLNLWTFSTINGSTNIEQSFKSKQYKVMLSVNPDKIVEEWMHRRMRERTITSKETRAG